MEAEVTGAHLGCPATYLHTTLISKFVKLMKQTRSQRFTLNRETTAACTDTVCHR